MTPFQKQVKTTLNTANVIYHDRIVCRKDGSVEVKRSYYYRTSTSEKWAGDVRAALQSMGIPYTVTDRDDWREWPTTSYYVAIVREPQP